MVSKKRSKGTHFQLCFRAFFESVACCGFFETNQRNHSAESKTTFSCFQRKKDKCAIYQIIRQVFSLGVVSLKPSKETTAHHLLRRFVFDPSPSLQRVDSSLTHLIRFAFRFVNDQYLFPPSKKRYVCDPSPSKRKSKRR